MEINKEEALIEKNVTYTLNVNDQIIVIQNVPARVNEETGEQFFSSSTVEYLQNTILDSNKPDHFIQVPVYNYSQKSA
ncbi:YgiT-type zinc finger protein [Synechococcus sp. PCC 6312]|uniref:YgiT-type zinc finger protein n=1 Tax=Synechococcus sp. (strain ATCC 27167 / PCC 6312) TaxID=195253 RepID=UPI00029ED997|nr:YgiT-type zinc finger protein [Synechococcus sp. PCC 6312]AFY61194.1 YgiT-type zinc finger domain protein [Synechococcus sp. PCC 6312]